jgi:hypothetical protein
MTVRCREEAETVLGPHFEDFTAIVLESVRFYYEFYGERAHTHEPWTRCSIIRDEIKERLTSYCESTTGFQPIREGNATYFGVHSKFTLRIKKLFDDLSANTGKTQLSFQFDRQVPVQGELFSDDDLTHVYLGYVAIENDPLNPPVYLVCNNEAGKVEWNIPLTSSAPPPPSGIISPPTAPPPSSPDAPRRIRVRPDAPPKKRENE